MNSIEAMELATIWIGDGMELARRVLALADQLDAESLDSATKSSVATDLRDLVRREFNPLEQPR